MLAREALQMRQAYPCIPGIDEKAIRCALQDNRGRGRGTVIQEVNKQGIRFLLRAGEVATA